MKITIENNDFSQTRGCFIFCDGKRIQNKQGGMFPHDFDENDIYELLGEKRFSQYSKGKFEFNLTKKEIFSATEDMRYYTPIK